MRSRGSARFLYTRHGVLKYDMRPTKGHVFCFSGLLPDRQSKCRVQDVRGQVFDVSLLGDQIDKNIGSWPDKEISQLQMELSRVEYVKGCVPNPHATAWTLSCRCRGLDDDEMRGKAETIGVDEAVVLCFGSRLQEALEVATPSVRQVGSSLMVSRIYSQLNKRKHLILIRDAG